MTTSTQQLYDRCKANPYMSNDAEFMEALRQMVNDAELGRIVKSVHYRNEGDPGCKPLYRFCFDYITEADSLDEAIEQAITYYNSFAAIAGGNS